MDENLEQKLSDKYNPADLHFSEELQRDPLLMVERIHERAKGTEAFKQFRKIMGSRSGELDGVFKDNILYLLDYHPSHKRAMLLYDLGKDLPEEGDPRASLKKRIYGMPGRMYPYVSNVVGSEKDPKKIKRSFGRTIGDIVKTGWPVAAAGGAWSVADAAYKSYVSKGLLARGAEALGGSLLDYLSGGTALEAAGSAGGFFASEGLAALWGMLGTPLLYGIAGYALYRTAKYFIKRHKEKKLHERQVEELDTFRRNILDDPVQRLMLLSGGAVA